MTTEHPTTGHPPSAGHTHVYTTALTWAGSTGLGYTTYDRTHELTAAPADQSLQLASDPAFGGNPALLNPEQLLVAAASSCQLLAFLAVAARARIDVIGYADGATAVMPEDDQPMRITRIELNPVITVRGDTSDERLTTLVGIGHRECFIASSLRSEIMITPTFVRVASDQDGR